MHATESVHRTLAFCSIIVSVIIMALWIKIGGSVNRLASGELERSSSIRRPLRLDSGLTDPRNKSFAFENNENYIRINSLQKCMYIIYNLKLYFKFITKKNRLFLHANHVITIQLNWNASIVSTINDSGVHFYCLGNQSNFDSSMKIFRYLRDVRDV